MSDLERRFTSGRVEFRASAEKSRSFGGYAAKFNKQSKNLGGFIERIDPGFFNKSKGDGWPDVIARYNHDNNMLLGTTAAGTLRLGVDNVGLEYEVDPPESRADIVELVSRGDVGKSSFAFEMFEDDWAASDQGFPMRTLVSGRLVDVAPVNIPAYNDTSVGLRSLANKFEVDVEEVRKLAEVDELIKFFKRTDGPQAPAKRSAAARLALAKSIQI
jgi:hypothetical protein